MSTAENYQAVGRRSRATARVYLRKGTGNITINGRELNEYFGSGAYRMIVRQALAAVNMVDKFDVLVTAAGGGISGQAYAIRMGISRALRAYDEELRGPLRKAGFLTRDSRKIERKKPGFRKARKKKQYSKR